MTIDQAKHIIEANYYLVMEYNSILVGMINIITN